MKLKQWLYGATALAMLAACSDKDIAPGGDVDDINGNGETASGYLAVEIKLPEQPSTRADEGMNDKYDDGQANEYNVENALIVLFTGPADSETELPQNLENLTFLRAQELTKPFFTNQPANDNITSSYLAAIEVVNKNFQDNLWGLVMLNRDESKYKYDKRSNTLTINTEVPAVAEGEEGTTTSKVIRTYGDLMNLECSNAANENEFVKKTVSPTDGTSYSKFFMTNAPMSKVIGGTGGVKNNLVNLKLKDFHILTNLGTAANLHDTEEEAKNEPAGCIFVERAVAKVTCNALDRNAIKLEFYKNEGAVEGTNEDQKLTIADSKEDNGIYVEASVKYCLANKNTRSYIVRNINNIAGHFSWDLNSDKGDKFRMIGSANMPALGAHLHQSPINLYRTYWCTDPNYSVAMPENEKYNDSEFVTPGNPLYCKENTFTVKHQAYGSTTLAVFQVDFNVWKDGKQVTDLFVRGDNRKVIFVDKKQAMSHVYAGLFADNVFKEALRACMKEGKTNADVKPLEYFDVELNDDGANNKDKIYIWNGITLKYKEGKDENDYYVSNLNEKFQEVVGTMDNKNSKLYEMISSLNYYYDVYKYQTGISYYVKPIKHFGDFSCPWDETTTGSTTEQVYNDGNAFGDDVQHAHNYLGRYGVLRNNWYDLSITEIASLGSPTFPDISDELSDDNNELKKYFAVEIHVLSWAKRTQSVKF